MTTTNRRQSISLRMVFVAILLLAFLLGAAAIFILPDAIVTQA